MKLPTVPIPAAFDPLDAAVDQWFDRHLRGRPWVDRLMYGASAVGDHGLVWIGVAGLRAAQQRRRGQPWRQPLARLVTALAVESVVVNGPVKLMFRRTRPRHEGPRPLHLRIPRTSSFPSGHAAAAFFGAALMRDDDPVWPLYYVLAVIIASSRVHVRIHHASDVVGGIATGVVLGELVRRYVPAE
jgi:undecaprenyl-diphosphatase